MIKRLMNLIALAIVAVGVTLVQQNLALNSRASDMPQGGMKLSGADESFVLKVAGAGMTEVEFGQLALKQAANEEVKQFAQRVVDDHGKANMELKQYAQSKSITLPAALDDNQKKEVDKLAKLSGADFDREFMGMMVKNHEKSVALFEKQSKDSKDQELKSWVDGKLPTLREHLQMARDIAPKVGAKVKPAEKPMR